MFSNLKYFFLYCYEAAEKMEGKADTLAAERAKRMEAFRAQRLEAQEKAKAKLDEMRSEIQRQVKEALGKVGVANKEEITELKGLIKNLALQIIIVIDLVKDSSSNVLAIKLCVGNLRIITRNVCIYTQFNWQLYCNFDDFLDRHLHFNPRYNCRSGIEL